ncbi:hypothetical protein U9M48_044432 [Paspalum notatum var. saurae]|uniref:Uncharacterized protein n=1 Tax=Paspalum notatum var. saurae TaxID=547442 RepID=A0AAQ3UZ61_PASNO
MIQMLLNQSLSFLLVQSSRPIEANTTSVQAPHADGSSIHLYRKQTYSTTASVTNALRSDIRQQL